MFHTLTYPRLAVAALCAATAIPALALEPLVAKHAALQCADRRIELQASCFQYVGNMLACTRQSLQFTGADGKVLGSRVFTPKPQEEGDDYPPIEEKVGTLSCVETKDKQQYVVASMFNGGNCPQCEWTDVYSRDGVLLGSTRERKGKNADVTAALEALRDKQVKRVLNQEPLRAFYQSRSDK
jgi:hypothetical protein